MLGIRTPEETTKHLAAVADEKARTAVDVEDLVEEQRFVSQLAAHIRRSWQAARSDKTRVEHNMLECLRERKGEYGPEELQFIREAGGSDIYVPLAMAKIRAGIAHTKAILLPAGAKAYGIEPTRNPSLPMFMQDMIAERIVSNPNMVDDEGQPVDAMAQVDLLMDMARQELTDMSKRAARGMERKITDQLQEGGWYRAMSDFIDDLFTYPAAFMKGPFFAMEPVLKWERTRGGMKPVQTYEKRVKFRTINPFDAYPAPGVDSVHKGDFIERVRLSRGELYRMREMPGYNARAIDEVLMDQSTGRLENWLWTDSARQSIAEHQYFWYKSTTELDGLHWFGRAQGTALIEWGMPPLMVPDPLDEYEVDAILIGGHVVRASLNPDPLYRRMVHATAFEKVPGSVFGKCPSMLMRNTQRMVNAAARAMQNNLAHASGFQVEVDYSRVSAETDIHDLYPFKVWQARESEFSGDRPAVRFFQPQSNTQELIGVIDYFKQMADNDTGIPEFLHGGPGASEGATGTYRGQSMLLDQSAKLLRSSIGNVDEDIAMPILTMLYDHNMLYDEDESIKGDSQVVAKGANAMLQRENSRQATMALLEVTNNETDMQIIGLEGRAHLVQNLVRSFEDIDADQVIPSDEALEAKLAQIAATPPPPDPAMAKVEATMQLEQSKMQLEQQRMQFEQQKFAATLEQQVMTDRMKMQSAEKIEQKKLDQTMQDEIVRLRATRMSERERLSIEIQKEKLKAETEVRLKVAEIKASRETAREQTKAQMSTAAPVEPAITDADIRNVVESVVAPMIDSFRTDTLRVMDQLTAKISAEESAPQTINVNVDMPAQPPISKTVRTTRDAAGNLTATVEPR